MAKFNVTYEMITPESAEHGEAEETGFELESVSLREALEFLRWHGTYFEADSSPISRDFPPRWFTQYCDADYCTGDTRNFGLHLPQDITPSSAMRVARLLGVR